MFHEGVFFLIMKKVEMEVFMEEEKKKDYTVVGCVFSTYWIVTYHDEIMKDPSKAAFKEAPSFLRRMTVEEAAILQTFPIEYEFCGSQSSKYTQIGNAVPCNMAKAVATMVINVLNGEENVIFEPTEHNLFDFNYAES